MVAYLRLKASINQRCDRLDVTITILCRRMNLRRLEPDAKPPIVFQGTPAKHQRRSSLQMEDRWTIHCAGGLTEKRNKHIAGILVWQQANQFLAFQTL